MCSRVLVISEVSIFYRMICLTTGRNPYKTLNAVMEW
jgi:hypothetical protein